MANIAPSDILIVQRPAGTGAGTYKTPVSDLLDATGQLWKEEDDGKLEPVNPDGYLDGGIYAISIDGVVDDIQLTANGSGYPGGMQENIATTGGQGSGLTISYRRSLDIVTPETLHVYSPGQGYEAGDVVTVVGGNGDMQIEILHVISTS